MQRQDLLQRLAQPRTYDLAIVGGGATGLGAALEAAVRGYSVVVLESHDFAKGTSSRATKLVHGGVRYLAQGNVALVKEALHERANLMNNAPHLAQPLPFVMPSYKWWETPFYGAGLKLYDALGGRISNRAGLGDTEFLGAAKVQELLPNINARGLKGGVKYWDGQFDDARLALALARTAAQHGALLVNYCAVDGLLHEGGQLVGLTARDTETGKAFRVGARCIVNATGVWVDALRQIDGEAAGRSNQQSAVVKDMVAPSQGVHLVVDRSFWPCDHALLVPKTEDGRVLFAVPWLGKTILGTTDTPRQDLPREPQPFAQEVQFILREAARYLARAPQREDVLSIWVGLRPLVKPPEDEGGNTKALSREHTVLVSKSGLVTVTGGKWTTYRAMAQDVLERCWASGRLPRRVQAANASTQHQALYAAPDRSQTNSPSHRISAPPGAHLYGSEADALKALPGADHLLGHGLTEAMVRYAARFEYARTVEDVLARRSRLLFLDARLAEQLAEPVATLLRHELGQDPNFNPQTQAFKDLAKQYQHLP